MLLLRYVVACSHYFGTLMPLGEVGVYTITIVGRYPRRLTLVAIPVLYLMLLRDQESNFKTCHSICRKSLNRALVRLDD